MAAVRLLFLLLLISSLSPISLSLSENQALLKLNRSFTHANALSSWVPDSSPYSAKCKGVICSGGIITGLHLAGLGLSGKIDVDALLDLIEQHGAPTIFIEHLISCSNQRFLQVDTQQPQRLRVAASETTKKKRKPKLSFFEQIREKWSLKLSSTREKFPWEEPEQQEKLEKDDQEEENKRDSSGDFVSNSYGESLSDPISFVLTDGFVSAPWVHGSNTRNLRLDSEPEAIHKSCEKTKAFDRSVGPCGNGVPKNVLQRIERVEIKEREVDCDRELETEGNVFNAIHVSEEETKVLIGRNAGGSVRLLWKRGAGDIRKRSNTELAERMLPEHELRRLRNVSLRMLERTKVGVGGITPALVDSIHEKWWSDEVVKLKFEGLAVDMRRTRLRL
ncbi:hypothetical protein CJ030_MR8G004912 [Morella rubra]|uniref:CRM domain-containing protein n=1 Tax=Morella rubra TaxID=262757 RepID=A0A6A1US59_9ROSI|nr:hypothetical protein CJ030_MR8G004912 [Morella rubra]